MKTNPESKNKSSKHRIPLQLLLVILVLIAVVAAFLITGPTDDTVNPQPTTRPPAALSSTLSAPPVTAEHNPTDGVIIGTATIMIILLAGTVMVIRPSLKKNS